MLDARRCLVVGGSKVAVQLDSTEVLDIATMTFVAGPVMGSVRWACAAVPLDSTHVLVVGGEDSEGAHLATTEVIPRLTKKI